MKNIKYFQYKNTKAFEEFLSSYDYKLEDVKGFKLIDQKQYRGNVLKSYFICLKDGEELYFKAVDFASFNEYHQARLGFKGEKLLRWYEDADVRQYKEKYLNTYVIKD